MSSFTSTGAKHARGAQIHIQTKYSQYNKMNKPKFKKTEFGKMETWTKSVHKFYILPIDTPTGNTEKEREGEGRGRGRERKIESQR